MPDDDPSLRYLPYHDPRRAAARHREMVRLQAETLARHQDNPAVQEWLRQFRDDGRGFLESYADSRASSLTAGRNQLEYEQRLDQELAREAKHRLREIQQRKLFAEQVRWRAGEATAADAHVHTAADFRHWGYKIKKCHWLPRITAEEVEDYLTYLASPYCADADPEAVQPDDFQDYDAFRRYLLLRGDDYDPAGVLRRRRPAPLAGEALWYPGWYAWCDQRDGPPNLVLARPNLRGFANGPDDDDAEEGDFSGLFRPALPPPPPPTPEPTGPAPLPWLGYAAYAGLTATLMREQETAELQRYHQACLPPPTEPEAPAVAEVERLLNNAGHEAGRRLTEIPERLPIAAAEDWREALHLTWLDHRKRCLATAIRAAFATYQARQPGH
ncbi:hypothetical protein [Hymenobacter ruricola]|uniref:Uncharacterized protein n=1 Tax=Hymenobacter ruricola TaxID=2791023 RepID=A0ABS0I907_9BACT|nr:hypothetical protein [Hymenobacter ruricola]MBF9223451.1 hypothetical protein [Hymenobacter ruricola]